MGLRLGEIAVLTFKKGSKYDNLFKIPLAYAFEMMDSSVYFNMK